LLLFALLLSTFLAAADEPAIQCSDLYASILSPAINHNVERIGDERTLTDFLSHPGAHSREEYYQAAAKVVRVSSFIHEQGIDKYPVYAKLSPLLEKLGPEYRALFLDPGIVSHGDELAGFLAKNSGHAWKDPWELRRAFSDALGTKTMFRGMALTAAEAEKLRTGGLAAGYLRQERFEGFVRNLGTPYEAQLKRHVSGNTTQSMFQSVTSYKEVAAAVGKRRLESVSAPKDGALYVFRLEVPKLDLVEFSSDGYRPSTTYGGSFGKPIFSVRFGDRTVADKIAGGSELESFVFYGLQPGEIKDVEKIEDARKWMFVSPAGAQ
jgi:hypothetical protein